MAALCRQLLGKLREQAPPWSGRGAVPAWVAQQKAAVSVCLYLSVLFVLAKFGADMRECPALCMCVGEGHYMMEVCHTESGFHAICRPSNTCFLGSPLTSDGMQME